MRKPVRNTLLACVAVALAAVIVVTIVSDRKLLRAAEQVTTAEELREFERLCPNNTIIGIHHSGWTRIYYVPLWIPVFVREITFSRDRGKWPPSVSSEISLRWPWR
jgi:hypothetical protein